MIAHPAMTGRMRGKRALAASALLCAAAGFAQRVSSTPASTLAATPAATPASASAAGAPSAGTPSPLPEYVSHGRFDRVAIYAPPQTPTSVVLFLSNDAGWTRADTDVALELVRHGALVAGIDWPKLAADFDSDSDECVFADGDLENLSHFLQAFHHLPTYLAPFLIGRGAGANLAYGALTQAPADTFAGALTLGFCPAASMRKPLCAGAGVDYTRRPGARRAEFLPARRLGNPWVLLQGERDQTCSPEVAKDFIAHMPGAALVVLPRVGHEYAATDQWLPQFLAAFDSLAAHSAARALPPAPAALSDLPVIEVPARSGAASDTFAIILSGDGGWAGLDKDVALALSEEGIPVVGLDSLRYFWSARTPAGLASDTDRMIRYYLAHLNKQRVLLIGYSQGADVLPFAMNRLPAATRARVALSALMGMSEHALFEFHVSSWISESSSGLPTLPEVNRMSGAPVLCIYGEDESDSLCPKLDPKRVRILKLKGGHHFDGDYAGLARAILASVQP